MQGFKGYLAERYKNAIGDDPLKREYVDQVWDLLQSSYAAIGGIKGNGFGSKEDMIAKIPMWKMAVKDGKVEAAILYKDKGGRKSVAMGSTGSDWARTKIAEMLKAELTRSYGEKSKAALGSVLKQYPEEALKPFLHTPTQVQKVAKDDVIIPLTSVPEKDWPKDAQMTLSKYPYIKKYGYFREIGGNQVFKVMIGTPGKEIK